MKRPLTSEWGESKDSYRLTAKAWRIVGGDRLLLTAPCHDCGATVRVMRSGTIHEGCCAGIRNNSEGTTAVQASDGRCTIAAFGTSELATPRYHVRWPRTASSSSGPLRVLEELAPDA